MHLCPDAPGFARDFYSSMLLLLFDATHQRAEGDIIDVVDRTNTNRQPFSSFFWVWGRGLREETRQANKVALSSLTAGLRCPYRQIRFTY